MSSSCSKTVAESIRIHDCYAAEGGSCQPPLSDVGRTVRGTCLPRMFTHADSTDVTDFNPIVVDRATESPQVAMPSCRELPASVFSHEEIYGDRPDTLPPGFHLRQTPTDIANCVRISRKGRQCKLLYNPNLYGLVMGAGYRVIFVRYIRQQSTPACPNAHEWIYAECIFFAYSITFHVSMLNAPGVRFFPAFVPVPASDPNFWARSVTDHIGPMNTVPPMPPGTYVTFGRLPGRLSVRQTKKGDDYILTAKAGRAHPIVDGKCLFPPLEENGTPLSDPSYQDGGVAYVVHRMNYREMGFQDESVQPGQPIALYARLAFGALALASVPEQRRLVYEAVKFAMKNAPGPFMALDTCHSGEEGETFGKVYAAPAEEYGTAMEEGRFNVVDVEEQTAFQLARHILVDNPTATFHEAVREAKFQMALAALPDLDGDSAQTEVVVDGLARVYLSEEYGPVQALVSSSRSLCATWRDLTCVAPAGYYMAPPDPVAFGELPVVTVGFILRVSLGRERTSLGSTFTKPEVYELYKTISNLTTRFMWDMMFFNSQLSVVGAKKETLLNLFTEKAPGMLGVWSGKTGLPSRTTSTSKSRRIKNPHEALFNKDTPFVVETSDASLAEPPIEHILPAITREEANRNPLLKLMIRGPPLPSEVPGVDVSVYKSGTKAEVTHWPGTCHAWTTHAGLVEACIMKPRTADFLWGYFGPEVGPEERAAAVDILYAPFYNSVKGQNWKLDGFWRSPLFRRREWETAYGVSVTDMHRAMGFLVYPAFASEHDSPKAIDIWSLKQRCEAVLHFMSRYGRIVRGVLQNRRRRVRHDVTFVIRNYISQVGQRVPGAPIANLFLSGYNAFSKCLILGGDVHDSGPDAGTLPEDGPRVQDVGTLIGPPRLRAAPVVLQEITTSEFHNGILHPNDAEDFMDEVGLDDGDAVFDSDSEPEFNEEEAMASVFGGLRGNSAAPGTLSFPTSLGYEMASMGSLGNFRTVIGSVRSCGPGTLYLMAEIESAYDALPVLDDELPPTPRKRMRL